MAHHSGCRRLDFTVLDRVCGRRLDFGCTAEKRKEEVGNGRTRLCTRKMDVPFLRDRFFRRHTTVVRHCAVSRVVLKRKGEIYGKHEEIYLAQKDIHYCRGADFVFAAFWQDAICLFLPSS